MERDFGSWFHHQHSDWQSPNLNSFPSGFDIGQQSTAPAYPGANNISTNGTMPLFDFSVLPNSKAGQPTGTQGWFYCMPHFCQAFAPGLNSLPKEKLHDNLEDNSKGHEVTNGGSGCAQKRFIVVDQSGDQTTLIFSSGIGNPVQCMTSWNNKTPAIYNLNHVEAGAKKTVTYDPSLLPFLAANNNEENCKDDVGSDMREDTEELNALLYSDDEYHSEDDEETSTGHSPSTMTAHDKQEWDVESGEEVASSAGPTKKQKLSDGSYRVLSLVDTASPLKPNRSFEYEEDAQSSCRDDKSQELGGLGTFCGNKRSRKEKIRETVSILQSIIPNGKGKDPIVVLDEAINYLKSLKVKAKSLGLHDL